MTVRPSPPLSTPVDSALDGVESSLTDRYQTTVPQPVRRALGLGKRDRIRYSFRANGEVVLHASAQTQQRRIRHWRRS
jgi:antitoxin PrlF